MHHANPESVTTHRVNYSETDQMGVVYHAQYLVWLDVARTEHLRQVGYSYKGLEEEGIRLAVTDLQIRYRQPARFDDLIRVRCRVREVASRKVVFGYRVEHAESGLPLADAETSLICLDAQFRLARLPSAVVAALAPKDEGATA